MTSANEPTQFPIRPATRCDYDAIVSLWKAAGLSVRLTGRDNQESFEYQLERFGKLYLVAMDGEQIVGVIFGTHDERKGWINRLAVSPEMRRKGIAAALTNACDAALRAEGIEIVAALIEPDNQASLELFERLGFLADVEVKYVRKLSRADI